MAPKDSEYWHIYLEIPALLILKPGSHNANNHLDGDCEIVRSSSDHVATQNVPVMQYGQTVTKQEQTENRRRPPAAPAPHPAAAPRKKPFRGSVHMVGADGLLTHNRQEYPLCVRPSKQELAQAPPTDSRGAAAQALSTNARSALN